MENIAELAWERVKKPTSVGGLGVSVAQHVLMHMAVLPGICEKLHCPQAEEHPEERAAKDATSAPLLCGMAVDGQARVQISHVKLRLTETETETGTERQTFFAASSGEPGPALPVLSSARCVSIKK